MTPFINPISTVDLIIFSAGYLGLAVMVMVFLLAIIFGLPWAIQVFARQQQDVDEHSLDRTLRDFVDGLNQGRFL